LNDLSARRIAAEVVRRVLSEDSFAAAVLGAELSRHAQLEGRDRAFATELAYGALRTGRYLEGRFGKLATRGITTFDEETRAHLWVAGYQLLFLSSVPSHAAVNEAVEAIKLSRGKGLASFANAVLRKLSAEGGALSVSDAMVAGSPRWLLRAVDRALGPGEGKAFVAAGPLPPPVGLRVRRGDVEGWIARLSAELPGADITRGQASPRAILVRGAGDPRLLSGIESGDLTVQEEGSQVVAEALGALPGERVLDACAGRGNKSLALADAVGPTGRVDAADLHEQKLLRLQEEAARTATPLGSLHAVDWSVGPGDVPESTYDRVLIDAPCSGTGTLRRRPEILLRRTEADVARLADLQRAILANAARTVKPGGTLVYAVCSVLQEEMERVIESLPAFTLRSVTRLAPHRTATDGYAFAHLTRE
jgi:16S rRNA (cytosine967-C5)-methyltransferase